MCEKVVCASIWNAREMAIDRCHEDYVVKNNKILKGMISIVYIDMN